MTSWIAGHGIGKERCTTRKQTNGVKTEYAFSVVQIIAGAFGAQWWRYAALTKRCNREGQCTIDYSTWEQEEVETFSKNNTTRLTGQVEQSSNRIVAVYIDTWLVPSERVPLFITLVEERVLHLDPFVCLFGRTELEFFSATTWRIETKFSS